MRDILVAALNISKSTVTKIIQIFNSRGDVRNAPKLERRRKTTSRIDKTILRISKLDPRKTSTQIETKSRSNLVLT